MASKKGLGHFLEEKAEGPAYAIVFVCMASRAASFYSAGALALAHLLGPVGLGIYNSVTGLGIAVGSGLVVSVAGRQWRGARGELLEVDSRKGLSKPERATLKAYWTQEAAKHRLFMTVALVLETAAALFFFWTGSSSHDLVSFAGEACISVAAVFIAFYFGVMKDHKGPSVSEESQDISHGTRIDAVRGAGVRIKEGRFTPQDVYLVAQDLPRRERAGFVAALLPGDDSDPLWTVPDLMTWLGSSDASLRRKLYRRLGKLAEKQPAIVNDPAAGWRLPRSAAYAAFMDLFLELHTPASVQSVVNPSTRVRHLPRGRAENTAVDTTATRRGRATTPLATGEEMPALSLN